MAHFSLAEMAAKSIPLSQMLLKSTLPDIGISWADFFVGKALLRLLSEGRFIVYTWGHACRYGTDDSDINQYLIQRRLQ